MLRLRDFEPHPNEKRWLHKMKGGFRVLLDNSGKVTTVVLGESYAEQVPFLENFEQLIDVSVQFVDGVARAFDEEQFQTLISNTRIQALKFVSIELSKTQIVGLRVMPKLFWLRFNNCKLNDESVREITEIKSVRHLTIREESEFELETFTLFKSLHSLESLEINANMIPLKDHSRLMRDLRGKVVTR